jgi:hypothetical protein
VGVRSTFLRPGAWGPARRELCRLGARLQEAQTAPSAPSIADLILRALEMLTKVL